MRSSCRREHPTARTRGDRECLLVIQTTEPMQDDANAGFQAKPLIVLGSRSPRRHDLLKLIVPEEQIVVCPPQSPDEPGFHGIRGLAGIKQQLRQVVRHKSQNLKQQWEALTESVPFQDKRSACECTLAIIADTVVVVQGEDSEPIALGQPPGDGWKDCVRGWFLDYYLGRTHLVLTAWQVWRCDDSRWTDSASRLREGIAESRVTMDAGTSELVDWYLETDEPRGKAGGYAIQGAGSVFVSTLEGSWSNVVGLPLESLLPAMTELTANS